MSKNIVIQEGGIGKQLTAGKLKTDLVGGDTCLWVPKDEVRLGTKNITENGTYKARSDGFYGFSQVTVNVQGSGESITGKDPETGNEKQVTVDPETGEIVETVIPSEIRVITPPTFTGPYGDGAYIDFTGLSVAAYDANGDKMQDVPFGELIFPITVARYDPDASGEYGRATSSLLPTGGYVPIYNSPLCNYELINPTRNNSIYIGIVGAMGGIHKRSNNAYGLVFASESRKEISYFNRWLRIDYDGNISTYDSATQQPVGNIYTHNSKTVYWVTVSLPGDNTIEGIHTIPTYDAPVMDAGYVDKIAWTMIYGDTEITGGTQIPVQWQRPGDGATLEASFGIIVTDISPNNNDGN